VKAGQPYELFWELTFFEIGMILEGVNQRHVQQHNDRAWMAWHIAAMGRAEKMPRLDRLTAKKPRPSGQTWEEQMAIMKALSARVNQRAAKARK
jgi:hypothetical protein